MAIVDVTGDEEGDLADLLVEIKGGKKGGVGVSISSYCPDQFD